jgi:hypothetical protein
VRETPDWGRWLNAVWGGAGDDASTGNRSRGARDWIRDVTGTSAPSSGHAAALSPRMFLRRPIEPLRIRAPFWQGDFPAYWAFVLGSCMGSSHVLESSLLRIAFG